MMFQRYVLTAMLIILVLAAVCGAAAGRDAADTANTSIQQDPHVASLAGSAKSSIQLRCGLVTDASSNTIFALCPGPQLLSSQQTARWAVSWAGLLDASSHPTNITYELSSSALEVEEQGVMYHLSGRLIPDASCKRKATARCKVPAIAAGNAILNHNQRTYSHTIKLPRPTLYTSKRSGHAKVEAIQLLLTCKSRQPCPVHARMRISFTGNSMDAALDDQVQQQLQDLRKEARKDKYICRDIKTGKIADHDQLGFPAPDDAVCLTNTSKHASRPKQPAIAASVPAEPEASVSDLGGYPGDGRVTPFFWDANTQATAIKLAKVVSVMYDSDCDPMQVMNWTCHKCLSYPGVTYVTSYRTSAADGCQAQLCNAPFLDYFCRDAGLKVSVINDFVMVVRIKDLVAPGEDGLAVVFRGTVSDSNQWASQLFDWISGYEQLTGERDGRNLGGINKSWSCPLRVFTDILFPRLQSMYQIDPSLPRRVFVAGHSRGGAIAAGFAAQLIHSKLMNISGQGSKPSGPITSVSLYTFGSPRPGDAQLAYTIEASIAERFRIQMRWDPVPQVPISDDSLGLVSNIFNPQHFRPLVWYIMPDIDPTSKVAWSKSNDNCYCQDQHQQYVPGPSTSCNAIQYCSNARFNITDTPLFNQTMTTFCSKWGEAGSLYAPDWNLIGDHKVFRVDDHSYYLDVALTDVKNCGSLPPIY